jgi:hypothetical protein
MKRIRDYFFERIVTECVIAYLRMLWWLSFFSKSAEHKFDRIVKQIKDAREGKYE